MQITFDTNTDTIDKVLAVTHAAFGVVPQGKRIDGVSLTADANDAIGPVRTIAAADEIDPTRQSSGVIQSTTLNPADNPATGIDTTQKDKDGLPWDARVHSTPPTMNADGLWRAKRGRKDEDYAVVKSEYAPAASAPPAPPAPPAAPAPLAPVVVAKTAYQLIADFLATHIAAGTNGCSAEWVKESLTNMGVADGNVMNLQGMPDDKLAEIHNAFKSALGVA